MQHACGVRVVFLEHAMELLAFAGRLFALQINGASTTRYNIICHSVPFLWASVAGGIASCAKRVVLWYEHHQSEDELYNLSKRIQQSVEHSRESLYPRRQARDKSELYYMPTCDVIRRCRTCRRREKHAFWMCVGEKKVPVWYSPGDPGVCPRGSVFLYQALF